MAENRDRMKLGVPLFPLERWGNLETLIGAVRGADELGFGSVGIPEHLVNPIEPDGGRLPPSALYYAVFVLATALACATSRIRIHLSALLVPYRHPLPTAKALA